MTSPAEAAHAPGAGPDLDEQSYLPAPEETILRMRHQILTGRHWFDALLEAVGRWRVPEERIGDRHYRYLIGGDAFDWLLLAERLTGEALDLIPAGECDALLFQGEWPAAIEDSEFIERLGPAKHSAHLNYLYGVLVEEALQLAVEEDIHKQNRNRPWGHEEDDETMFERVYGKPLIELRAQYYEETGVMLGDPVSYPDWKEFTYWLFRTRLKRQDKARVASDTRKGLAQLSRMELAVSERRHGATLGESDFAARYGV
ncbi:MAG: hypothetical protein HYX53_12770 [Chloroflexi bacterium]|nr:hypothetical protein [Chloroflexota bacterium]